MLKNTDFRVDDTLCSPKTSQIPYCFDVLKWLQLQPNDTLQIYGCAGVTDPRLALHISVGAK